MKEFFGLWLFGTIAVVVMIYLMGLIFVSGAAFITWDASAFKEGMAQADWVTFRVSVALGVFIGLIFASVADEL